MIIFSDDFSVDNQATNYTSANGAFSVTGGILRATAESPAFLITTTTAHAAIADVKVSVIQKTAAGDSGALARVTDDGVTPTMYAVDVFSNTIETLRYNDSTTATVLQSSGVTSVANGVVALQVTGSGATVTLKAFYQGVQVGADISDTSGSRITAAGQTGVAIYNVGQVNGDSDCDDFSVDDLAGAGGNFVPYQPNYQRLPLMAG